MQNGNSGTPRVEALRQMMAQAVAESLEGDEPLFCALKGEAIDLGHPQVNAVVERTARRLAGIPDLAAVQLAEVRGMSDAKIIVTDIVLDAIAEIDGLCGLRPKPA